MSNNKQFTDEEMARGGQNRPGGGARSTEQPWEPADHPEFADGDLQVRVMKLKVKPWLPTRYSYEIGRVNPKRPGMLSRYIPGFVRQVGPGKVELEPVAVRIGNLMIAAEEWIQEQLNAEAMALVDQRAERDLKNAKFNTGKRPGAKRLDEFERDTK